MRTPEQVMQILRQRVVEKKSELTGKSDDWHHGYIRGLETALLFLGEQQAVDEHNEIIKNLMGEEYGI